MTHVNSQFQSTMLQEISLVCLYMEQKGGSHLNNINLALSKPALSQPSNIGCLRDGVRKDAVPKRYYIKCNIGSALITWREAESRVENATTQHSPSCETP